MKSVKTHDSVISGGTEFLTRREKIEMTGHGPDM